MKEVIRFFIMMALAVIVFVDSSFADDKDDKNKDKELMVVTSVGKAEEQRTYIPQEESKITQDYLNALVLSGLKRVFSSGLDFTPDGGGKVNLDLSAARSIVECAFEYSLLNITSGKTDLYENCIKSTGLIEMNNRGKLQLDMSKDRELIIIIPHFLGGNEEYPGPLYLIKWAIENYGVNLFKGGESRDKFKNLTAQAIELIRVRKSIGESEYLNKMDECLKGMQKIVDEDAKTKVSREDIKTLANLKRLRLTEETALILGEEVYANVGKAHTNTRITSDKAKLLAEEFIKALHKFGLDKYHSREERAPYLDDLITMYNELSNFYNGKVVSQGKNLEAYGAIFLAQDSIVKYNLQDSKMDDGDGGDDIDVLRNAFYVGRVLRDREGTMEYKPAVREKERVIENQFREVKLKKYNSMSRPMLGASDNAQKTKNATESIQDTPGKTYDYGKNKDAAKKEEL